MSERAIEWLRALLEGDFDRHRALTDELGNDGINEAQPLLTAAFFTAVDRHFKPEQERADIIQFVAEVRAQFDATGDDLDPRLTERLIRIALGEDLAIDGFDQKEIVKTQGVLLFKLFTLDRGTSGEDLDGLIAEAQGLARRWSA